MTIHEVVKKTGLGISGLAMTVSSFGALKNEFTNTQFNVQLISDLNTPAFSLPLRDKGLAELPQGLNADTVKNLFQGIPAEQFALMVYATFNLDKNSITGHAPLDDQRFLEEAKPHFFGSKKSFDIIDTLRGGNSLGGINAAAYRHKESNKLFIVVVGLETDNPKRDTFSDIKDLILNGMLAQTKALFEFVERVEKNEGEKSILVGQSLGSIPVDAVNIHRQLIEQSTGTPHPSAIKLEPRALSNEYSEHIATLLYKIKGHKFNQETVLAEILNSSVHIYSLPNAWNCGRTESFGEGKAHHPLQSYLLISKDEYKNLSVTHPFIRLVESGIIGPHQASRMVKPLAFEESEVFRVENMPKNQAEVLQSKGKETVYWSTAVGVILVSAELFTLFKAYQCLTKKFNKTPPTA
jgi:hypothetical protein